MVKAATKTARGRPTADDPMKQIAIRFPESMLAEIDAIIADRMDRPDRSAIIRQMVAEGLEQRKKERK